MAIAYLNVKLPGGANIAEAEGVARHQAQGWKCDDWRTEADRITGMRRMQTARKLSPMTLKQRRGFVRVEFSF